MRKDAGIFLPAAPRTEGFADSAEDGGVGDAQQEGRGQRGTEPG
jgi:hypothetical protein